MRDAARRGRFRRRGHRPHGPIGMAAPSRISRAGQSPSHAQSSRLSATAIGEECGGRDFPGSGSRVRSSAKRVATVRRSTKRHTRLDRSVGRGGEGAVGLGGDPRRAAAVAEQSRIAEIGRAVDDPGARMAGAGAVVIGLGRCRRRSRSTGRCRDASSAAPVRRRRRRACRADRGRQLQVHRGQQFLQLLHAGRAGDRRGDAGLRGEPGQRDLRERRAGFRRDLVHRREHRRALAVEIRLHPRRRARSCRNRRRERYLPVRKPEARP